MPLVNLQTNLKSLKYGHDRPNGGSSNQPYIKVKVDNPATTLRDLYINGAVRQVLGDKISGQLGKIIDKAVNFDDGFVRGGTIGATNAAITDTLRIGKFFVDLPRGPLFIAKQVGLQLSNPQLEHINTLATDRRGTSNPIRGQGFLTNAGNAITNAATAIGPFISNTANALENLIGPTRIYNLGINTLAQIPVNAIGGHIVRHGLLPTNDSSKYYENVITIKNFQNKSNRLLDLTANFNLGPAGNNKGEVTQAGIQGAFQNSVLSVLNGGITTGGIPNGDALSNIALTAAASALYYKQNTISDYSGGPNSVYGIGRTTIQRKTDTENKEKIDFAVNQSKLFAGHTRDVSGSWSEVNYNTDLSKDSAGSPSISNYDFPPGYHSASAVDQTVVNYKNPSPRFRTYTELQKQIAEQQQAKHFQYSFMDPTTNESYDISYNQFGIYNTTTSSFTKSKNKSSDYSDQDISQIGYINTYGNDVVFSKKFNTWKKIAREQRTGDFGSSDTVYLEFSGSEKIVYTKTVERADSINLTPIYTTDRYDSSDTVKVGGIEYNIRDLAKFKIQSIITDEPDKSNFMVFRALITGLSDSIDAKWNDINYVGRGTPLFIYTGTTRKVSVKFKVAALSMDEMNPIYSKLNYLIASLMPDYSSTKSSGVMRGPLHRLTIGNYFDAQLGIITSLSYSIPDDAPWEIALDEPEGGVAALILPHIIEVSMEFTPIGAETQGKNKIEDKNRATTYIAQNNTGGDKNVIQYYDSFFDNVKTENIKKINKSLLASIPLDDAPPTEIIPPTTP